MVRWRREYPVPPRCPIFAAQFKQTMAQDPQAQAIRKRKATLKIARLKAAAEALPEAEKAAKKASKKSAPKA